MIHRPLRPATKLVFAVLASLEDVSRGYAWPSIARLEEITGLSRKGVVLQLTALERLGVLTVHRTRLSNGLNAGNLYRLNVPDHYREQDRNWNNAAPNQEWDAEEGRVWSPHTDQWESVDDGTPF